MASLDARVITNKDPSMADEPIIVEISGLQPSMKITLHSSIRAPNAAVYECFAHYIADNRDSWIVPKKSKICLDRCESIGGDYKGVEAMGFMSFMKPSNLNKRKYERFLIKDPTKPFHVELRVFDGHIPSLEDMSAEKRFHTNPHLTITRTYMAPGVVEIPVWDGNVRATLYLPPGKGPFPGIISMSGGYPGAMKFKAALYARHGYAALALKFFGEDDLTDDAITQDLEYIEEAAVFLKNHPSVYGRHGVGIIGNCFGGTLALMASAVLPKHLIRCVVTINGWPFSLGSFYYKGKELCIDSNPTIQISVSADGIHTWISSLPSYLTVEQLKSFTLPFYNKHDASYLFITGEYDGYCPSLQYGSYVRMLFNDARHPDYELLCYEKAGHLIEHQYYPLANVAWTFKEPHFNGGQQPEHSKAQCDSWGKMFDFIGEKLRVYPESKL